MRYILVIMAALCFNGISTQDTLANTPVLNTVKVARNVTVRNVRRLARVGKATARGVKLVGATTIRVGRSTGRVVKNAVQRRPGILVAKRCN